MTRVRACRWAAWSVATWLGWAVGCGSSGSKPDTGYGANETVPATINCADLCRRENDCFTHLCNEDTKSTRYAGLGQILEGQCLTSCTDSALREKLATASTDAWRCLFQSSCRMAIGENVCDASASYSCQ